MFATCGIENEIVESAEIEEVLPDCHIKVADAPSLIAMKILSANKARRPLDSMDIIYLLEKVDSKGLKKTKELLQLIQERGFNREKDLIKEMNSFVKNSKNSKEDPYLTEIKDFKERFK